MSNQVLPTQSELQAMHEIVDTLLKSGLYRQKKGDNYVNLTHEEAFAKVLFGWEIGVGAAQSMSAINIMQGKLSMSSAFMTGLMQRGGFNWISKEHNDDVCTLIIRNAEKEVLGEVTFTYKQAQDAGLPNKNANWKTYRQDMLFARCISAAARRFASAVFGGNSVYTPEELGADDKSPRYEKEIPVEEVAVEEKVITPELTPEQKAQLEYEAAVANKVTEIRNTLTQLSDKSDEKVAYLKAAAKRVDEELANTIARYDGKELIEFLKSAVELELLEQILVAIQNMIQEFVEEAPKAKPAKSTPKAAK